MAEAQVAQDLERLQEQCEYIWDIRDDRNLLQRELDLILEGSDEALTCRLPVNDPLLRETCEEECVALIASLLGGNPVAQLPADPY